MLGNVSAYTPSKDSSAGSNISPPRRPVFVTTRWSVVLRAGRNDTTRARDALARLCQSYWFPLYSYVRRRGYSAHDAEDLTQDFFARLLERQSLARADPGRGRFRSFILTAMNHFLATEWQKTQTQKRGGRCEVLSLDLAGAEQRYGLEPADQSSPDKAFDKQWALALLDEVVNRLEAEYRQEGRAGLFSSLKQTLTGTRETQPYAVLATRLGLSEGAVKAAVHRLRRRYRELLQSEIADTVAAPGEVNEELRHLFQALSEH
jgi:RNA polymerase sigma factor (sigma-70 family)